MPVPPVIQMYRYVMGSGGGLGNLLKASEEFQQTVDWVRYPSDSQTPTVNADSRPDPNGGTTADQVGFTANTGARLMQTVTLSASTQYTFSVHARAVSGTVDFRMRNVTLKAAVQKTATTTGPLTNGFTRFTYTFTTGAAGSYELALQNAAGTPTARDVIFWGAMLNQGGTALDYEYAAPTTGGSAPAPAYAGFGDAFGGVTAYYSLRQFTEAETLNAIRVRRSSDDTEQDIGFDANGDLDTTALLAFVNAERDIFTSDFSSGTTAGSGDGDITSITMNLTAPSSIGGQTDALEAECNGGSAPYDFRVRFLDNGQQHDVSFEYYIPSGNTIVEAIRFNDLSGVGSFTTKGAWTSVTLTDKTATNTILRFFAADSGGSTSIGSGVTESFYIRNLSVSQTTADGAVTTFYDQSGNGNDATNANESEQPLIVSGGTLVEENGKAAIQFDGVDDDLTNSFAASISQPTYWFVTHNFHSTPAAFGGVTGNIVGDPEHRVFLNGSLSYSLQAGGYIAYNSYQTTQCLITYKIDSADERFYLNGTEQTSSGGSGIGSGVLESIVLGSLSETFGHSPIQYQEIILFDSDQSSNRTGMETNINDHFDIYT